ncbi:hypothetical protein LCGC14_2190120 [marine sediment metagenome]|uniref:Uncharacterized protein n=1 Tax=marine sediment metagenome TaxID=412755 RepID=A0A0F9FX62_9ZZZZ
MKMFYSTLISYAQDAASDTSAATKTFLKRRINSRYELTTDKLNTWTQTITRTATTGTLAGADQQFYANPPNLREIESIVVAIGDQDYPLDPVYAQTEWDRLNAATTVTAYPEKYFRRAKDYGIWPTPNEDDGTITINYTQRASPLYFENYTTGTVTATENDQTLTFVTGNTSTMKPGFWFVLTDSSGEPRGTFYEILSITDSTNLELVTFFEEDTDAGATFIVGQVPAIPEEGHELPAIGAVSDFHNLKTKDLTTGTKFNNMFWTGSPNITALQAKRSDEHSGGLLGLIAGYEDRDNSAVVNRGTGIRHPLDIRNPRTIS